MPGRVCQWYMANGVCVSVKRKSVWLSTAVSDMWCCVKRCPKGIVNVWVSVCVSVHTNKTHSCWQQLTYKYVYIWHVVLFSCANEGYEAETRQCEAGLLIYLSLFWLRFLFASGLINIHYPWWLCASLKRDKTAVRSDGEGGVGGCLEIDSLWKEREKVES